MIGTQLKLNGLIAVLFAGGGGTCAGIEMALGRSPDIAINHDPEAISTHKANHPNTRHYCESVWEVSPRKVCNGESPELLWASPDCTHFSKAKGGKPLSKKIRSLAWVVVRWARDVKPRMIFVENVEEIKSWGPLLENGQPCPASKGETFKRWINELKGLGYQVEYRELRACDYGAPTTRKRLFVTARCDGQPIVWPEPTHGPGRAHPYRTAAECIDWSIPCPSIFERARPLAENTLRRIARGIKRYVLEAKEPFIVGVGGRMGQSPERTVERPFQTITTKADSALVVPTIVPLTHQGERRAHPANEPLPTVTGAHRGELALVAPVLAELGHGETPGRERKPADLHRPLGVQHAGGNKFALVAPTLVQTGYGEREGQAPRSLDLHQPLGTVMATGQKHALVSAFLAKHYSERLGQALRAGIPADGPLDTITTSDHHTLVTAHIQRDFGRSVGSAVEDPVLTITSKGKTSIVASHLIKLRGATATHPMTAQDLREPAPTITAGGTHLAEVRAFLVKYFGTSTGANLLDPLDTVTTRDRFGLVTVAGEQYEIADIGLRMLSPRELFRAQGFPDSYQIEVEHNGKVLSKTAQVRMCGNSVSPPCAAAIVLANVGATAAMGPTTDEWRPGLVESGEQMALFDLEAIA